MGWARVRCYLILWRNERPIPRIYKPMQNAHHDPRSRSLGRAGKGLMRSAGAEAPSWQTPKPGPVERPGPPSSSAAPSPSHAITGP